MPYVAPMFFTIVGAIFRRPGIHSSCWLMPRCLDYGRNTPAPQHTEHARNALHASRVLNKENIIQYKNTFSNRKPWLVDTQHPGNTTRRLWISQYPRAARSHSAFLNIHTHSCFERYANFFSFLDPFTTLLHLALLAGLWLVFAFAPLASTLHKEDGGSDRI